MTDVKQTLPNGVVITQKTYRNGRYYTVEGDPNVDEGARFTSVTTAQGVIAKDFLPFWAAKVATECMETLVREEFADQFASMNLQMKSPSEANYDTGAACAVIEWARQGYTLEEIYKCDFVKIADSEIVEMAFEFGRQGQYETFQKSLQDKAVFSKAEWRRQSEEAGEVGTIVHRWIDEFLHPDTEWSEHPIPEDNYQVYNAIMAFLKWYEHKFPEIAGEDGYFLAREMMLYHEGLFAGEVDAVIQLGDGSVALLDWKTSSRISEDYASQLGAYNIAYTYITGQIVSAAYVVRLDKEKGTFQQKKVDLIQSSEVFLRYLDTYKTRRTAKGMVWVE